jgi:hypothetical protein
LVLSLVVVVVGAAAAAAVVVVCRDHVVGEQAASKAGSVVQVCVLEKMIRMEVGCCSVLFGRAACSLGHRCSAGEMRTLKPLLVVRKSKVNTSRGIWISGTLRTGCDL